MQIFTAHSNTHNGNILPSRRYALNLTTVDISSNRFTGSLPQEIGNLVMMQSLSTSGNNLSGTIPRQVSHPCELNELDLRQNDFT
jgi:Leucine-rich repeat (LRR) protein